jgi:hypothetical protein
MNVETVRAALLWCAAINFAIVALWAALVFLAPGFIQWPRRWFPMSTEQLGAIHYGGILLYEIGIFLFNLVPYVALRILAS